MQLNLDCIRCILCKYFVSNLSINTLAEVSVDRIAAFLWMGMLYRLSAAIATIPDTQAWAWTIALLVAYALISLPIGFRLGFVQVEVLKGSWPLVAGIIAGSFLMPGMSEELFFRVLLFPHPTEKASLMTLWLWGCTSLFIFLVYHPLNIFAIGHDKTFREPVFLLLAALLGIACTISYWQSGSLWPPVVIHWLIVAVWLILLGGYRKLHS